ncbi:MULTISPECIES: hypothetical protein [Halomonas]|uniref:hypothetical protein n=1 Tax=Halomonas TaxID=2745 RepID=UPI001C94A1B8|nr:MULTISPECIES: hypothetical protein [Halomonas]MBY6206656.1 hypothetical protein [Halomonas sp. DP3Y7-2]MBY6230187.1 hypothetical protein [Halomonas sp. DP3Y7-1]MCA0918317.1 hypothetical protein [Halomonas denitrificans]
MNLLISTFVSMRVDRLHESKVISHAAVTLVVFGVDGFFDVGVFFCSFSAFNPLFVPLCGLRGDYLTKHGSLP